MLLMHVAASGPSNVTTWLVDRCCVVSKLPFVPRTLAAHSAGDRRTAGCPRQPEKSNSHGSVKHDSYSAQSRRSTPVAYRTTTSTIAWRSTRRASASVGPVIGAGGSGAGEASDDRAELLGVALGDREVADAELVPTALQRLADAVDRAEQRVGVAGQLVGADAEAGSHGGSGLDR